MKYVVPIFFHTNLPKNIFKCSKREAEINLETYSFPTS